MKVNINGTDYDSDEEPILLILTEEEKKSIKNLSSDSLVFKPGVYPHVSDEGTLEGLRCL